MLARLVQAQLAVHCEANFRGVFVFLAVVFPPADGAQRKRADRLQRPVSATWAAKSGQHSILNRIDGLPRLPVYEEGDFQPPSEITKSHSTAPLLCRELPPAPASSRRPPHIGIRCLGHP